MRLAILALSVLLVASINPGEPVAPSPPASTVTSIFNSNCSSCHGTNGAGSAGVQSFISNAKFEQTTDKPFFDAINTGVPGVSGHDFGTLWSDPRVWGLVVHIRELQKAGLRSQFGYPAPVAGVYHSLRHKFKVETVVPSGPGFNTPWAIDWLPDGRMLVTNRSGALWVVRNGQLGPQVQNIPPVFANGQGGLLDVAVHPGYKTNGWVYLALSDPRGPGSSISFTKVVRGKIVFSGDTATWTSQRTVFETPIENYSDSTIHFGCRIVFDKAGHTFISVGERGSGGLAQDRTKPNGKVFRVNDNGTIPADNPFVDQVSIDAGYIPAIWSFGHRNPQGLVMDLDGDLWDVEHGPRGGDELNRIVKGANYGWPNICFGINYSDTPFVSPWPKPTQNYKLPNFRWVPSIAPGAVEVVRGAGFPNWRGDFLVGGLVGNTLERVRMSAGQLVEHEELLYGLGRVRDVALGPDGNVYLALNEPDEIVRLVRTK